ncbi:L,D-transpeptidase [Microcoleus sp. bin38.metabat.b11b12b14.051]|uniref:L,D-transpeptidase n=1 Tax=Microcoleus sp. bin38.metabat.b11b12b14.051 TaxID=2742709 RepID=UPI0025E5DCF3|nr:L,D-transpeptidase [Microcoleus sp. bin38.metabat.b11b12b14.051]
MNNIIKSTYLRRAGTFCAGCVLTVAAFCGGLAPAFAAEQHNTIANRIMQLQQSSQRWIEIDLSRQKLIAWEGNKPVYAVNISSGKSSTPTRTGTFAVQTKYRVARMTGDDYDVPDVPYTMYYDGGNAIHGAYWHNLFGNPVTHGCTNVAVNHAKWLFNWASVGTPVVVHKSEI